MRLIGKRTLRGRVKELERQIEEGVSVEMPIAGSEESVWVKITHCDLAELFFNHVKGHASKESK